MKREEKNNPKAVTYTLSLLVTTIATFALYWVLRKCKGRASRFETILAIPQSLPTLQKTPVFAIFPS